MRLSNERITGLYGCFTFASFRVSCVCSCWFVCVSFNCVLCFVCIFMRMNIPITKRLQSYAFVLLITLHASYNFFQFCTERITMWWSGSGGIQAWSRRPTGFLQCFDTVGLVIWPVKIVPEMTYYVSSGTLNPTHSLTLTLIFRNAHSHWTHTFSGTDKPNRDRYPDDAARP